MNRASFSVEKYSHLIFQLIYYKKSIVSHGGEGHLFSKATARFLQAIFAGFWEAPSRQSWIFSRKIYWKILLIFIAKEFPSEMVRLINEFSILPSSSGFHVSP